MAVYYISGSVTSSLGNNVPNVTMSFYSSSGFTQSFYSDANGQYSASVSGGFDGVSIPTHSEWNYSFPT